jgi:hypothetical protein
MLVQGPLMARRRRIIPNQDHVVRYVSYSRQARDEDDNLIGNGLLWTALQQKKDEAFVSVNWLEYYGQFDEPLAKLDRLKRVRNDIATAFPPKPRTKSLLAIGSVSKVKCLCEKFGKPVRVTHEPSKTNPSHAGIRRLPAEEDELLDALVSEVFVDTVSVASLL